MIDCRERALHRFNEWAKEIKDITEYKGIKIKPETGESPGTWVMISLDLVYPFANGKFSEIRILSGDPEEDAEQQLEEEKIFMALGLPYKWLQVDGRGEIRFMNNQN